MTKSKKFFVNGKCAKLSENLVLELIGKYSKQRTSPNDIYAKVSKEIGLARSKKSIIKLTNLYKFVKVSHKINVFCIHSFNETTSNN